MLVVLLVVDVLAGVRFCLSTYKPDQLFSAQWWCSLPFWGTISTACKSLCITVCYVSLGLVSTSPCDAHITAFLMQWAVLFIPCSRVVASMHASLSQMAGNILCHIPQCCREICASWCSPAVGNTDNIRCCSLS